jgi:hypothetical protein
MTHRLNGFSIVALSAFFSLIAAGSLIPSADARQEPKVPGAAPDMVKWNLVRLHKEPFKLIKATPDPVRGQVRFLVEFTRRPELSELFDWEHRGGAVVFRFLDEDGVVMRTVRPQMEGEFVAEKGGRIRLVLQMPDVRTLEQTRSITAD